ncbi:MAG: hypothetical protein V4520_17185 [Bacteroidota bacterium]
MPKTLIALLLTFGIAVFSFACNPANSSSTRNATKEFEGVITYHEIIRNSDSTFNSDDTVQLFYSHGNYVGIHSERSPRFHLIKDYYFEKEALRLLLFNNSDTLHRLNLDFPTEKLDLFNIRKIDDKILSHKCEEIKISISYPEKDSTTYSDFTFVFSRGYLNVNKEHFKKWHLGFFNKVIDESGSFYLKWKAVHFDSSHKNILSSKTYDVISVKEQPIDPKIFEIDATKIK